MYQIHLKGVNKSEVIVLQMAKFFTMSIKLNKTISKVIA